VTLPPRDDRSGAPAHEDPSAGQDEDLSGDLALALRLAEAADAASMARFDAADLDVSTKADSTFVTESDLATERAIRDILSAERPDDGVLGEE
jgi:histidinol-phosphatase